ncbi:MAG: MGMT family protein [Candidatus Eisenbacteria sp.]|nr:MGMT family protein [Candidatus Eisenbacteria bacterium]
MPSAGSGGQWRRTPADRVGEQNGRPGAEGPGRSRLHDRIHDLLALIPRGRVATYGQLAALVGDCTPRMVGYAMAAVPFYVKIPWHRVINSRGKVSVRRREGDEDDQRRLLEAEGLTFDARGRLDLARVQWAGPTAAQWVRLEKQWRKGGVSGSDRNSRQSWVVPPETRGADRNRPEWRNRHVGDWRDADDVSGHLRRADLDRGSDLRDHPRRSLRQGCREDRGEVRGSMSSAEPLLRRLRGPAATECRAAAASRDPTLGLANSRNTVYGCSATAHR